MSAHRSSSPSFLGSVPVLPGAAPLQRLHPGDTVRLNARRAHVLCIDGGCAWVTLGKGPVDGVATPSVRAGDVFLHAGQLLRVPAGTRALVQAARGMELRFFWQQSDAIARKVVGRGGPSACDASGAAVC